MEVYGPTCLELEKSRKIKGPSLVYELVVLSRRLRSDRYYSGSDIQSRMGEWQWHPASPTLICVHTTAMSYVGKYLRKGERDVTFPGFENPFAPNAASASETVVTVLDANGITQTTISSQPPAETTDPYGTSVYAYQQSNLVASLVGWLKTR